MYYQNTFTLKKGHNCFQSAFLNMLRFRGIDIEDFLFQFQMAGIKIVDKHAHRIHGNFSDSVYEFCNINKINLMEEKFKGNKEELELKILTTLDEYGPFIIFLNSKLFRYDKCFNNNNSIRHCVVVNGISEEGVWIIDSFAAASEVNTYQGLLPFEEILEIKNSEEIVLCKLSSVYGKIDNLIQFEDIEECNKLIYLFFKENVQLEPESRCKKVLDYCAEMNKKGVDTTSQELKNIALNILIDTHVPQLRVVREMMDFLDMDIDGINLIIRKWSLISLKFLKLSMKRSNDLYLKVLEEYKNTILLEIELYREIIHAKKRDL